MPVNLAALRAELLADPSALGYAGLLAAGNHVGVAALLNQPRVGIVVKRDVIPSHEIFEAITAADYTALAAAEKTRLQVILSMGSVNVAGINTRAQLSSMFGAGTTTRTNILALIDRQGSRAEQLFGTGASVTVEDIGRAFAA